MSFIEEIFLIFSQIIKKMIRKIIASLIFLFLTKEVISDRSEIKYISIPFTVKDYNLTKDTTLMSQFLIKDIQVKLSVGEPKQELTLQVGLGEYTTFIIEKGAKGFDSGIYQRSISNSFSTQETKSTPYAFQTFSEGIHAKEKFIFGNPSITMNNFLFMLATEIGGNNCYYSYCEVMTQPGILGFKLAESETYDEEVNDTNLICQLKQKNLIDTYDLTFKFDKNKPNQGNIIIGQKPDEYDPEHYIKENFVYVRTAVEDKNNLDWSLKFDKIYLGEDELYNDYSILLRIEFGLITGYYNWQKNLEEKFFNKNIDSGLCYRKTGFWDGSSYFYYYCENNVNLTDFEPFTFIINDFEYNLTLTKDDLFINKDGKIIFLMIFSSGHTAIFGYTFFKKYQFIFNQDTKTIGIYKNNKKENESDSGIFSYAVIISILSIIAIVLFFVIIWYGYIRKLNSKKKAQELIDDEGEVEPNQEAFVSERFEPKDKKLLLEQSENIN